MEDKFTINGQAKKWIIALVGLGLIFTIIGTIGLGGHGHEGGDHHHHPFARLWANILLNGAWFTGIALCGTFFVAVHTVFQAGWSQLIRRIPEAMSFFLVVCALFMIVFAFVGAESVYHWMEASLTTPFVDGKANPEFDQILFGKSGFLNPGGYKIRMFVYFALWIGLTFWIINNSNKEDKIGGPKWHEKAIVQSSVFIVVFAVSTSLFAWDWVMSTDPHWFSTLFGWYLFSSYWVSALAIVTLIVILLKTWGYLKQVNDSHLHDLGKYLFAFSLLWMYLWFSQFMLIWYANIPEETHYFQHRWEHHPVLMGIMLFINFLCPFLILMTRNSKRNIANLAFMAVMILIGHYFDYFLLIMPNIHGLDLHGMPWIELGTVMLFLGMFGGVTFYMLSKRPLIPKNSPFLRESIKHHI